MRYPAGNEAGRKLFFDLAKRAEQDRYDDEFLQMLIEYREMYPSTEHFDLLYGRYAAFHGNYKVALEHAQKAYRKRKVNFEAWKLLAKCYVALGQPEKAIPFQGLCCKFYTRKLEVTMPLQELQRHLGELSVAMGRGTFAPFCEERMVLEGERLDSRKSVFVGEALSLPADGEGYAYWVGVYNEAGVRGGCGRLLQRVIGTEEFFESAGDECVFDIGRAKVMKEITVDPGEGTVILPVAAALGNQMVDFRSDAIADQAPAGQWEYNFFRIDQPTHVSSNAPLAFGRPIRLGHGPGRRKFVLNILVDALSWNVLREQDFRYMPRTMEFFSKGIIFNQHFSVAEFTYPALPSIETGMYPHHSQVFYERAAIYLDEGYATMSERMKELGYYCVNVMGGGDSVYNGATRGYDRLLVNAYDMPAYVGAERAVRQLEAFSECDQFLFLHFTELHPWAAMEYPTRLETQTKLSLRERLTGGKRNVPSVYLPNTELYQMANRQAMVDVDRSLGMLFDYIASHYDEEDYIIQLYSDHGVPIYDEHPSVLSDNQTSTAYMLRGSGVPAKGMVDELTSAVDIYPVLAKLAGFPVGDWVDGNLPAVFGGKEREYVFSNSLFPGQTYKLCIRTKEHEFYLESLKPVDLDGTVDLSGAEASIHARDGGDCLVEDPALERDFLRLAGEFTSSVNHEGRQWESVMHPCLDSFRAGWAPASNS